MLLLVDRRSSALKRYLAQAGYDVVESFTTDRAVAICVNNEIDVAVLDQACFVETDGWSVAQSLKVVKPNLCIVLVSSAKKLKGSLPQGVNALVNAANPEKVVDEVERLLHQSPAHRTRLA